MIGAQQKRQSPELRCSSEESLAPLGSDTLSSSGGGIVIAIVSFLLRRTRSDRRLDLRGRDFDAVQWGCKTGSNDLPCSHHQSDTSARVLGTC